MEGLDMTELRAMPDPEFWADRKVLVTGHTGFKGAWLTIWLSQMGAKVCGLSLPPNTQPNLYTAAGIDSLCNSHYCDIRDAAKTREIIHGFQPEVVLHLAAQALVHESYRQPLDTFSVNVQGTANVLDALRGLDSVKAVVAVTTDKVYQNLEQARAFFEDDPLGGHDPYSASKAAAEIVVDSYRKAFLSEQGVALASARAGNVVGGGDWSADRLIPDAIKAWGAGRAVDIRRPDAVRPWQHVLEPLAGYLILAQRLWREPALAQAYNFGPEDAQVATVREVIEQCANAYGSGKIDYAQAITGPHEARWLSLNVERARNALGVTPRWSLATTLERTMAWYLDFAKSSQAMDLCLADLNVYKNAYEDKTL